MPLSYATWDKLLFYITLYHYLLLFCGNIYTILWPVVLLFFCIHKHNSFSHVSQYSATRPNNTHRSCPPQRAPAHLVSQSACPSQSYGSPTGANCCNHNTPHCYRSAMTSVDLSATSLLLCRLIFL